jgi:hypothetical protein
MDYEEMWQELKRKVVDELEYFEDGTMCSFVEAVHGKIHCNWFLNTMRELEERKDF